MVGLIELGGRGVFEILFLYNRSGLTTFHRFHGQKPVLSPTGTENGLIVGEGAG